MFVLTEHVGRLDEGGVQVGPVEAALCVVDGESVSSAHVSHQSDPTCAVHRCPVDLWLPAPLGPVHVPEDRKQTEWFPSVSLIHILCGGSHAYLVYLKLTLPLLSPIT